MTVAMTLKKKKLHLHGNRYDKRAGQMSKQVVNTRVHAFVTNSADSIFVVLLNLRKFPLRLTDANLLSGPILSLARFIFRAFTTNVSVKTISYKLRQRPCHCFETAKIT